MSVMHDFLKDDGGATSIEYAVIAGLMAIALVAGAAFFTAKFAAVVSFLIDALS